MSSNSVNSYKRSAVHAVMKTEKQVPVGRARVITSQVLACLSLDFLLIGLGMSISFVTMVLPEVLHAKEGLSINEDQASWFGSMAFLCQPLGSIFSGPLLDHFGRKKALFLVNIPQLIAWTLMYYAWDVPSLFVANALLGIGTGLMEGPAITYVGEICDKSVRGILTTLTNGFTATGLFIAYLLGTVLPWRQAALVSLTVPLATMVLVLFVPETPIWLLSQGREKDALQSLCRLRGWANPEDVQEEYDLLVEYHELIHQCVICIKEGHTECTHRGTSIINRVIWKLKNILFVRETMRPFALVIAYFFFHIMTGFAPVRSNMVNLCKALGMKYDPKTIVVVFGAAQIIMSLISASLVNILGKRKLIISCLFATACCCIGISSYAGAYIPASVHSYDPDTFVDQKEIVPVILFLMLVCFYGLGLPWVLMSEVFPFRSRGISTGLAAAFAYSFFFVATKTNIDLDESLHLSGTFAIYACFGILGSIFLYFFLPETESKTLVEIETLYKGDKIVFADDWFINLFRKNSESTSDAHSPMLVNDTTIK